MHLNHPQTILTPGPWKNCLPQNLSLVPKTLGITDLLNRKNKHYIADLPKQLGFYQIDILILHEVSFKEKTVERQRERFG